MNQRKVLSIFVLCLLVAALPSLAGFERLRGPREDGTPQVELGAIVADPSFEAGSPNPSWAEFSTNFGTPLCTELTCGLGGGTGPNTGDWWAWFGGIAAPEEGSVGQMVTIPAGTATLTFGLEIPVCSGDASDFLEVTMDGSLVFLVTGVGGACDQIGYVQQSVDVSAWAGQMVSLEFHSIITGAGGLFTNFFVDDVDISVDSGGPMLTISGTCPSDVTIAVSGATPNGSAAIIASPAEGNAVIPSGPCAGVETGLGSVLLLGIVPLDGTGALSVTTSLPPVACGKFFQAVDAATCTLTNVDSP